MRGVWNGRHSGDGRGTERRLRADFDGLALWQQASADRSLRYLFIACHESVKDRAMAALREIGFSRSFRGLHGTAKRER